MFRYVRRVLAPLALLAALVALAAPAYAGSWTVKISNTITGSGTYTAASTGSVAVHDTTTGASYTCTSLNLSGAVPHLGGGQSGLGVLTVTSSAWGSCSGAAGVSFSFTQSGTWKLNLSSPSGLITNAYLSGINLTVATNVCSYTLSGSEDVTYNSASQLKLAPVSGSGHVLTVSATTGSCLGLWRNGDVQFISATLPVSAVTTTGITGPLAFTYP